MPVLRPGAAIELSWSVDTALLTVDASVQGPPDGGVLEVGIAGEVRSVQRRDRVRARCVYPCELVLPEIDGTWTIVKSETVDLSATGIAVRRSQPLEPDSRCGVVLYIPDEAPLLLAARVANSFADTGRMGLGFTSVLPGDADRISALIARLLTTRAAR
jgi:hypothetical protein